MTIFKLRDCVITGLEAERRIHSPDGAAVTQLPSRAELDHLHRERQFERCRATSKAIDIGFIATLVCMGLWMTYRAVGL